MDFLKIFFDVTLKIFALFKFLYVFNDILVNLIRFVLVNTD